VNAHDQLLQSLRETSAASPERKALLEPTPLLHSKQLEAELPRYRQHVGPRVWYQWIEKSASKPLE